MACMVNLNAGNDRNGNPRRIFILIQRGGIVGGWDEGFRGTDAVPPSLRLAASRATTIAITSGQYRSLKRRFEPPRMRRRR